MRNRGRHMQREKDRDRERIRRVENERRKMRRKWIEKKRQGKGDGSSLFPEVIQAHQQSNWWRVVQEAVQIKKIVRVKRMSARNIWKRSKGKRGTQKKRE